MEIQISRELEPEGIIIENVATAKAYKSYFDVLWKTARPFK